MPGEQTADALQLKGGKCCVKFLRKSNVRQRKLITDILLYCRRSTCQFCVPGPRLLAEEEDKMKALMSLQEEQEEYILKTQREKQELKQEMEAKSRALEEAQRQLEEVRANRHRVDQDVVVRGTPSL